MFIVWLIVAVVCALIELMGTDFVFLMLAGGALGAAVAALFTHSLLIQVIVFGVLATALLLILRPILRNHLTHDLPNRKMNIHSIVGRSCQTLSPVTPDGGQVTINGDTWTAKTQNNEFLVKGQKATVIDIDGATVIVSANTQPKETLWKQ